MQIGNLRYAYAAMRCLVLVMAVQCSKSAWAEGTDRVQELLSKEQSVFGIKRCQRSSDEIVVCGQRSDRFRLPLPNESAIESIAGHHAGELPRATAETPSLVKPCGIFQDERKCSKWETRRERQVLREMDDGSDLK